MKPKFYLLALPLLPLTALAAALADELTDAQQAHTLGVHQHGLATLSLAVNQQQLVLELFAPAADIVGFEHAPQNIEQEQQQAAAFTRVQEGPALFTLPKQAQCAFIKSELLVQEGDELDDAAAHADDHQHAKADAQQEQAHDHDHDEHNNDHDDHHHDHGHSDVLVKYHYQCQQPQALTRLDTQLFAQFASLNNIELQGIVASGQVAATLTPEHAGAAW